MKNWSRAIQWQPDQILLPESVEAIQQIVLAARKQQKNIRIIGSGHSFNPLWVTKDILVSLDHYQGLISVDQPSCQATIKGGTKLSLLGDLLFEQGMAMENLGDIDQQSIAGTISTGTHGTGKNFGTISTQVTAIQLVNGLGKIVSCSENKNAALFKAAQVSLGALGIITSVTLQCVPAYKLALESKKEDLQLVLSELDQRQNQDRNFEFYWFPHSTKVWTKAANIADGQADKIGWLNYFTEYVVENYAFKVLCEAARFFPALNKTVAKISADAIPTVTKIHQSHKVYATKRLVRFNEMEYNIPVEAHKDVLQEIIKTINSGKFNVHFPIENRVVKGDDIYLSPAFGRDSAYIACHVYNKKKFEPFFRRMEAIFLAHDGRPHWGKKHFLTCKELQNKYPKFDQFLQHRTQQDPDGIFLNDYLKTIFQ